MLFLLLFCCVHAPVRMELPRVSYGNAMRRAIYYSLCCFSCGCCGCCECFYVLPAPPPPPPPLQLLLLLLLLLLSVLRLLRVLLRTAAAAAPAFCCCCCLLSFLKVGLPEATNNHCSGSWLVQLVRNKRGQPVECFLFNL